MTTLDFGMDSQYRTHFSTSPVFECALGIAAFTREEIYDKLDRNLNDLHAMRERMAKELSGEVYLSGKVHTWRSLLYLAHRCPNLTNSSWEEHIKLFLEWMTDNEADLIELAAPYLGEAYVPELKDALAGNVTAQQNLIQSHLDNPVVHLNLRYLFTVNSHTFLNHLKILLECWYDEFVSSDIVATMDALRRDQLHNQQLAETMPSKDLIRSVTKGSELQPVPGADTLWLIPQLNYRPFTIINYLPHCVVYYYPVADEFLPGGIDQNQIMQVAALHKALGDVQRIRLLTLIRHRPKSLAELTDVLNATKSNVHHHLTLLRTVGLVHVENGIYSIDHTAVADVGDELRSLLKG